MTVDEMKAELRRQAATWFNNPTLLVLESFIAEYDKRDAAWRENMRAHRAVTCMVREAIETLFGAAASLESEDAVLLRGPEPHHDAEAIIAALQRVAAELEAQADKTARIELPDGTSVVLFQGEHGGAGSSSEPQP